MILAGLIGCPVAHSASPELFRKIFLREGFENARYELFPMKTTGEFQEILQKHKHLTGLNVTIPHKVSILPCLDELSNEAAQIGSVNTLLIQRNSGNLFVKGFNTDTTGFRDMLGKYLYQRPKGALILGSGGVSRTVQYVLNSEKIPYMMVSRSPEKGDLQYAEIGSQHLQDYPLIINCTPLGMHPDTNTYPPLPFDKITADNTVFDLVYNPPETMLMRKASGAGANVCNGLVMLHAQAEKAFEIWKPYF
jgi:shikimate dehydrogenase